MKQFFAIAAAIAFVAPPPSVVSAAAGRVESAALNAANRASVRTVSVVPTSGRAEVVIGVDASVEVDDFTLESPYRIVIDLKGATLAMAPRYDRQARGGVTNIRAAQNKPNVVRVVIELDAPHPYDVSRGDGQVLVDVSGGVASFSAWHSSPDAAQRAGASGNSRAPVAPSAPAEPAEKPDAPPARDVPDASTTADANITSDSPAGQGLSASNQFSLKPATMLSEQPRITVTYQDADIRDVIAAFAAFSGRTIVVGKDVAGTVTAEIKNQPWDVALRAILQGQGLAAAEDAISGIITVDSYANILNRQASEPLQTQLISINYARAVALVPTIQSLLQKDCPQAPSSPNVANNSAFGCASRGL